MSAPADQVAVPGRPDIAIVEKLVALLRAHPHRGPRKPLNLMQRQIPRRQLASVSTAARILAREGLVKPWRHYRRAHHACPKSQPQGPNDIRAADFMVLIRTSPWP